MSIVYIGTSPFAARVLEGLVAAANRPTLVLTRPPSRQGRGRRESPSPVAATSAALGLAVIAPERLADAGADIERAAPELLCLCAYGGLVREPLLSRYEILNVHPSLLPRWRGAAPVERAIIAGDTDTGVSLIRLVAMLDAGPLCSQESTPIGPQDNHGTLAARLAMISVRLLVDALEGPRRYVDQDESAVTYAEKISAHDRVLDPGRPAVELERTVRALHPHIGARTPDGLRVLRARVANGVAAPGTLANVHGALLFGTNPGALELQCVQPPGGRPMDAAAFLRGHDL